MNSNVAVRLGQQAARCPDAIALVFADGKGSWDTWTYAVLHARSDAYARGFEARGLRRGDRTLFLVKPSLESYALLLGLLKMGAIPTVVDPGMGIAKVLQCIEQIRPRAVLATPLVHAVRLVARRPFATADLLFVHGRKLLLPGTSTGDVLAAGQGGRYDVGEFGEDDEAFIVFTSGSTGLPKGVSVTHGMFAGVMRLMEKELGFAPGRCSLETFAPFVVIHLAAGEKVVVPEMDMSKPATADPGKIVQAVIDHRPECAFASPVVLSRVMEHLRATGIRLDSLKLVLTGVAPVPWVLHRDLVPMLGDGARIRVNYGATEALAVTWIETPEITGETWAKTARGHGNCVGAAYQGMEARVIRITDEPVAVWSDDLRVPPGEIGEIVVKGPVASPEYKDLPDANARAKIRDADGSLLHRMGDLGYLDERGRLWFCGRKAHRIETARGMVPNVAVESVFNEHPAVARSALVGVGPGGAQVPVLCVELAPGYGWNDALAREILARAEDTRWRGVVERALPHPGFALDTRHNSKIRNEDLRAWAEKVASTT